MGNADEIHAAGVKRHAGAWFTANLAAVSAARAAGLDPVRYMDAIALIVLRVLDVVGDRLREAERFSFKMPDVDRKRMESNVAHKLARELALIPGRERDANIISAEAARIDQELAAMEAALRGPASDGP